MPYQQMGIKESCIFGQHNSRTFLFVFPVFSDVLACFRSHLLIFSRLSPWEEIEKRIGFSEFKQNHWLLTTALQTLHCQTSWVSLVSLIQWRLLWTLTALIIASKCSFQLLNKRWDCSIPRLSASSGGSMPGDCWAPELGVVWYMSGARREGCGQCGAVPVHHQPGSYLFTLQGLGCFSDTRCALIFPSKSFCCVYCTVFI